MNPGIPAPDCTADEVGVEIGDTEVVNRGHFARRANRFDLDQLPIVTNQLLGNLPAFVMCLAPDLEAPAFVMCLAPDLEAPDLEPLGQC